MYAPSDPDPWIARASLTRIAGSRWMVWCFDWWACWYPGGAGFAGLHEWVGLVGRVVRSRSAGGAVGTGPWVVVAGLWVGVGWSARHGGRAGRRPSAAGGACCPGGLGRGRYRCRGPPTLVARRTG